MEKYTKPEFEVMEFGEENILTDSVAPGFVAQPTQTNTKAGNWNIQIQIEE